MFPKLSLRLQTAYGADIHDILVESIKRQTLIKNILEENDDLQFSIETFVPKGSDISSDELFSVKDTMTKYITLLNQITNGSSQQRDCAKVMYNIIIRTADYDTSRNEAIRYFGEEVSKSFQQIYNYALKLIEAARKYAISFSSAKEYGFNVKVSPYRTILSTDLYTDFEFNEDISSLSSVESKPIENVNNECNWLIMQCKEFCSQNSLFIFSKYELAKEIWKLFNSSYNSCHHNISSTAELMQSSLFELIGENGFEFMGEILQNIHLLQKITLSSLESEIKRYENIDNNFPDVSTHRSSKSSNQRRNNQSVSVNNVADNMSQSDILTALGFSNDYVEQERLLGLHGGRIHQEVDDIHTTLSQYGGGLEYHEKRGLPAGTSRITGIGFEEVFMPAPAKPAHANVNDLVPIEALESWAQLAFPNTKSLNRIQSKVFNTAYNSSENILICAPTGTSITFFISHLYDFF